MKVTVYLYFCLSIGEFPSYHGFGNTAKSSDALDFLKIQNVATASFSISKAVKTHGNYLLTRFVLLCIHATSSCNVASSCNVVPRKGNIRENAKEEWAEEGGDNWLQEGQYVEDRQMDKGN